MGSSLYTDVTQRIYVVTDVSEQPFDPIFKGQALVFLALVWYLVIYVFRGNLTVPSSRVKQSSLLGHGLIVIDVSEQPKQENLLGHGLVVVDVSEQSRQ
jgi:hypothetical protein